MSLAILARRAALVACRHSVAPTFIRALATTTGKVDKPNPEGMSGDVLDDMLEKTTKLESSMQELKETYAKKQQLSQTVKWMDPDEIEGLFDVAGRQKQEMEAQLAEMKSMVEAAKTNYAVDAPDGESDGHLEEELEQVNHIIEEASHAIDPTKVTAEQVAQAKNIIKAAAANYAVDAPDGESDGRIEEELEEIKRIIDEEAEKKTA